MYRNDANGASSWIDHFVCDDGLAAKALPVVPLYCGVNLSDHVPVTVTLDLPVNIVTPVFDISDF